MDLTYEELAKQSLNKVKHYKVLENYGRAYAHYLLFLELNATKDLSNHEKPFGGILISWCIDLESKNDVENLCKCYLQGLHYFPASSLILNSFGKHLLRLNQAEEAMKYLRKAHSLKSNSLPIEKNLSSAKAAVMEQWHYRMLNDPVRNLGFYKAFQNLLNQESNFALDIGTGSGLLSLLASKVYFEKNIENFQIVAFELSNTLVNVATEVFKSNNANAHVTLINTDSTALNKINYVNVQRHMVLITEIFDTALFGEHVLSTLIHAHNNLLSNSFNLITIPHSADLYIFGAECFKLCLNKRLLNDNLKKFQLKFPNRDIKVKFDELEPYDAHDLTKYNFKKVTNTHKVLSVKFKDLEQLQKLYTCDDASPSFNLKFIENDFKCDCFVIYFDLHLGPDVTISTNPFRNENSCKCWEQAIIYLDHPIATKIGEQIENIKVSTVNNKLQLKMTNNEPKVDSLLLQEESIQLLNDVELMETLENASNSVKLRENELNTILDLYSVPILGLLLLKQKTTRNLTTTSKEVEFVKVLCEMNEINLNQIVFVKDNDLLQHICNENKRFDVIIYNPVWKNGVLNEELYSKPELFQATLNDGGFFVPESVTICCQLVHSPYLDICTRVLDKNVLNFDIARHMNDYSVLEVWDLNKNFKHTKLGQLQKIPICLCKDEICTETTVILPKFDSETNTLTANGAFYSFESNFAGFNFRTGLQITSYASLAAFVFENPVNLQNMECETTFIVKQHAGLLKIYPKL